MCLAREVKTPDRVPRFWFRRDVPGARTMEIMMRTFTEPRASGLKLIYLHILEDDSYHDASSEFSVVTTLFNTMTADGGTCPSE